jgi:hypothetical protein
MLRTSLLTCLLGWVFFGCGLWPLDLPAQVAPAPTTPAVVSGTSAGPTFRQRIEAGYKALKKSFGQRSAQHGLETLGWLLLLLVFLVFLWVAMLIVGVLFLTFYLNDRSQGGFLIGAIVLLALSLPLLIGSIFGIFKRGNRGRGIRK